MNPDISVVIPMYNAGATIDAQLEALASQQVDGTFEVVVADNGSTDDGPDRVRRWADRFDRLRVVDASSERGVHHARNTGIAAAEADKLLICDADDVVRPGWIAALAGALDRYDVAGGLLATDRINTELEQVWSGPGPLSTTPETGALRRHRGGIDFAVGANLGLRRAVWEAVDGFRSDYDGCEDVDFSMRAQLAGFTLGPAPEAVVDYRLRSDLRSLARTFYFYGKGAARFSRNELDSQRRVATMQGRPGQPSGTARSSTTLLGWLLRTAPAAVVSPRQRGLWVRTFAHALGFLVGRLRG